METENVQVAKKYTKIRKIAGRLAHDVNGPQDVAHVAIRVLEEALPTFCRLYNAAQERGEITQPLAVGTLETIKAAPEEISHSLAKIRATVKVFMDELDEQIPNPELLARRAKRKAQQAKGEWQCRYQVLVVDDEIVNQDVLTGILEDFLCHVTLASNGNEALELMAREKFDMVLMDCRMPHCSGFEATRRFREWERENQKSQTPVIGLTASPLQEDREKGLSSGMNDFIVKPLEHHTIVNLMGSHILSIAST